MFLVRGVSKKLIDADDVPFRLAHPIRYKEVFAGENPVVSISKNTESSANKAFVRVSVLSKFNSLCQVCIVFLSSCLSWKYSTIFCFFYKYFFRVFFSVQGKLT